MPPLTSFPDDRQLLTTIMQGVLLVAVWSWFLVEAMLLERQKRRNRR